MGAANGFVLLLLFGGATAILVSQRSLWDALIEEIKNFRGGPPTAMHPSPANDGALLRRRLGKGRSEPQVRDEQSRGS